MRLILDLYKKANQRPGARVYWRWWEQASIDLKGAKKRAEEATTLSESGLEAELDVE